MCADLHYGIYNSYAYIANKQVDTQIIIAFYANILMTTIDAIKVFLLVAKNGSFSAAAKTLDVAVSSVSRSITGLEEDLGVALFARTTRSLTLTEAGSLFEQRAREIVEGFDELKEAVLDLDQTPKGVLRITAPLSLGRLHIVPAVLEFMDLWPELRIDLDITDQVVDLIGQNIDVGIRIGALPDSSFTARRLGSVKRFVYGSPQYLDKFGTPTQPDDLRHHQCLRFQPFELSPLWRETLDVWRFAKGGKTIEIPVDGRLRVNTGEAIVNAALEGHGLILMLDWIVSEHVKNKRLIPVLTDYVAAPYAGDAAAFAVYPGGRKASAKVRAFIDFLQLYFERHLRVD